MDGGRSLSRSFDEQTIIAQCTARGPGALALIRITGSDACVVADNISVLASGKKISELPSHTIHYGTVVDAQHVIMDQVLFLIMRASATFTGQDTVEITCHNNQFTIEAIIERAIFCGARLAQAGEFSRRAFLNGKMDLLQAESINEFIHAQTAVGLKKALGQIKGTLSSWVISIEQELLRCLSYCEASFEFIDEELEFKDQIREKISAIVDAIEQIKTSFHVQQQIREGIRIAIIGSVNAGKSSLFNLLLGKDRSIVTPLAGTTRDSIEASQYCEGIYWTFIDTAGLRTTDDLIEQEGIVRSLHEAEKADIILLVFDGSRELTEQEYISYSDLIIRFSEKIVLVQTKSDLPAVSHLFDAQQTVSVSNGDPHSIRQMQSVLRDQVARLMSVHEVPYLLNQRQFNLLLALERELEEIEEILNADAVAYELLAHHLRSSLVCLTQLTGKSVDKAVLDTVFQQFCVGK